MSGVRRSHRAHRPRSLRVRFTAAFALVSLAIVGFLGVATYVFAEHYLVRQREESLLRQAFVDARVLRDEVQRHQTVNAALDALDLTTRSNVVLQIDGRWYGSAVSAGPPTVPGDVRTVVAGGEPARQRVDLDGRPVLVVGLPLPSVGTQYYEIFELDELQQTLDILRTALVGSGVLAVVFGGLLGWWLSRRVLRPVADVALAAERVAGGDLGTRIRAEDDPDLRSLADSFNRMVDAVERRIERETRFVADVSHELRSPLTTLSTATELMAARRAELSPRAARALDLLETEVQRLCRLVEDLLELGRADAGVADLQLEPVDVGELVRQVLHPPEAAHNGVELVAPDHPVFARVDKRRLERVLVNLFANADSHGGGLERVTVVPDGAAVRIEVEDAGPGVEPADREAVFRRFFRGAAAGRRASTPGAGLGLALVAEHVQLHGGSVSIEARDGPGARFVVELPGVRP